MDLEILNKCVESGENRTDVIESLTADSEFEKWYNQISNEASLILSE